MEFGNLNVGFGLCLDIDTANCEATLYSPNSIPLTVAGTGICCGEESVSSEYYSINRINFGSGFKITEGSDGSSEDCCTGEHGVRNHRSVRSPR
jgi:hypothetical protein